MAARVGVSRQDVVARAVAMLDDGATTSEVTLVAIARELGIRPQSLYAHVDGADGLTRAIAVAGLASLAAEVAPAAIGRNGPAAVEAIVRAHADFALRRGVLYLATIQPPGSDAELHEAIDAVNRPLEIVLTSLGMAAAEQVHWTRLFLASLSGYLILRREGRLSIPVDPDETLERLINMVVGQLPVEAGNRQTIGRVLAP